MIPFCWFINLSLIQCNTDTHLMFVYNSTNHPYVYFRHFSSSKKHLVRLQIPLVRLFRCLLRFNMNSKSTGDITICLFDLILYVPSTIFLLNRDGSSWVEPLLF